MCLCVDRSPERQNEGHVAVRFGDAAPGCKIFLDDVDVTNYCTEAQGGSPGWVIVYDRPTHTCRPLVIHEVKRSGSVRIEMSTRVRT